MSSTKVGSNSLFQTQRSTCFALVYFSVCFTLRSLRIKQIGVCVFGLYNPKFQFTLSHFFVDQGWATSSPPATCNPSLRLQWPQKHSENIFKSEISSNLVLRLTCQNLLLFSLEGTARLSQSAIPDKLIFHPVVGCPLIFLEMCQDFRKGRDWSYEGKGRRYHWKIANCFFFYGILHMH